MKTNRRGFIGASIFAAIPSFGLARSVFSQENTKPLVHKWNPMGRVVESGTAVVSCQKLHDPEICVGTWKLPEYWIEIEITGKNVPTNYPIGKIIENDVLFVDRDGKEVIVKRSRDSRILLASHSWSVGCNLEKIGQHDACRCVPFLICKFLFQEVPAVIFQEKRATAEEIFGVSDFPSIGQ